MAPPKAQPSGVCRAQARATRLLGGVLFASAFCTLLMARHRCPARLRRGGSRCQDDIRELLQRESSPSASFHDYERSQSKYRRGTKSKNVGIRGGGVSEDESPRDVEEWLPMTNKERYVLGEMRRRLGRAILYYTRGFWMEALLLLTSSSYQTPRCTSLTYPSAALSFVLIYSNEKENPDDVQLLFFVDTSTKRLKCIEIESKTPIKEDSWLANDPPAKFPVTVGIQVGSTSSQPAATEHLNSTIYWRREVGAAGLLQTPPPKRKEFESQWKSGIVGVDKEGGFVL
eukprot:jgi/Bigna1/82805/fgenesh1_pg.97_\